MSNLEVPTILRFFPKLFVLANNTCMASVFSPIPISNSNTPRGPLNLSCFRSCPTIVNFVGVYLILFPILATSNDVPVVAFVTNRRLPRTWVVLFWDAEMCEFANSFTYKNIRLAIYDQSKAKVALNFPL